MALAGCTHTHTHTHAYTCGQQCLLASATICHKVTLRIRQVGKPTFYGPSLPFNIYILCPSCGRIWVTWRGVLASLSVCLCVCECCLSVCVCVFVTVCVCLGQLTLCVSACPSAKIKCSDSHAYKNEISIKY